MTTTTAPMAPARLAWVPLVWMGALHLGALLVFIPAYFSWSGLAICLFLHWLTGGIGICMTYHRLLTHRSFALRPRWLEYPLTILGACASEGGRSGGCRTTTSTMLTLTKRMIRIPHPWLFLGPHVLVDEGGEFGTLAEYYRNGHRPTRSVHRWLESFHIVFPLRSLVLARQDELAGLGRVIPSICAPFDMAGEFGEPRLGLSVASDP